MIRRLNLILFLEMAALFCRADDFTFVKFGQNEGLKHSQILDISQDSNGSLWLCTAAQVVYRFDGKSFFPYKIFIKDYSGSIFTLKIVADAQNTLWILTNIGLIKFNGSESIKISLMGDLLTGQKSKMLIDGHQKLWIIDEKGDVFSLDNNVLRQRHDIVHALGYKAAGYYFDHDRNVCFYSSEGKAVIVDVAGAMKEQALPWKHTGSLDYIYRSIDSDIIGMRSEIMEITKASSVSVALPKGLMGTTIHRIAKDRSGLIWVQVGSQIVMIDRRKKTHLLDGVSGLTTSNVLCFFEDKDGYIWISVDANGIIKFKKQVWEKIPDTAGKDITCMSETHEGEMLFGTYNDGVVGWQNPMLTGNYISSIMEKSSQEILVGMMGKGLYSVTTKSTKRIKLGSLSFDNVYGIAAGSDEIIAGTTEGLYVIIANKIRTYSKAFHGRWVSMGNPIMVGDDVIFTGSTSGLMKLIGDSIVQIGPDFQKESTLYSVRRQAWGGYVVAGEFSKILFFDKNFNYEKSLDVGSFASNVLVVEFLNETNAIIGSNDGLFKINFSDREIKSVRKFGKVDGYGEEEMYAGSSVRRKNGEIIIGTIDGAYRFKPGNDEVTAYPAIMYLTSVKWLHEELATHSEGFAGYFRIPQNPILGHQQNSISFSYSYSNLTNPGEVRFQHQLKGIESSWSELSASEDITYSNLKPGRYDFRVQAVQDGKIFGNVQEYSFTILPAFWQTQWFYLLMGLVVVVGIVVVVQAVSASRITQHKLVESVKATESVKMKKQMSMDFHDEMGNKLAGMLAQASLLKAKHTGSELAKNFDYFEKTAYAIFHGTKDFIWTIDVNSNNLQEVISYLRDFADQLFERNNIMLHIRDNILDNKFNQALPDGYNRHIILIFKEAMTNALRHSQCKNVFFSVKAEGSFIEMSFADDGIWGAESLHGKGIRNMYTRAARINSTLSISQKQERTTVTLSLRAK